MATILVFYIVKTKISKKKGRSPPPTPTVMILIGGALKRMLKLGHKAPRRVLPRGLSEAVAQEIHQGETELLPKGNLVLL